MRHLVMCMLTVVCAAGFAHGQMASSLYSDHKAQTPGDLLTVLIVETAQAENKAKTETESKDNTGARVSRGNGYLDFFPGADIEANISNSYFGSGSNVRSGSLRGKITVRIDSILPGGSYEISGQRVVDANKEKQIMELRGVVRPRDIQQDNTVYSYLIANAEITYRGRGVVAAAHKPGILRRIFNWIF